MYSMLEILGKFILFLESLSSICLKVYLPIGGLTINVPSVCLSVNVLPFSQAKVRSMAIEYVCGEFLLNQVNIYKDFCYFDRTSCF